jgi:hypothetical protein
VPAVDLVDETFVVVDRAALASVVADPARWRAWWPDLVLTVFMDRGLDGIRWSVAGAWVGSLEVWLEPVGDGVLLHHYARLDRSGLDRSDDAVAGGGPAPTARARRRDARARARLARSWKRTVWGLKDELEVGREVGTPRVAVSAPPAR